jgi:UDP-glucose 4-epimerase
MNILVTGGAGYIGSHTVQQLRAAQFGVVVYDNFTKGHTKAIPPGVPIIDGDIRERDKLAKTIKENQIAAVVHFAAFSLVGESMQQPSLYYNNNVAGTLTLLDTMLACGVNRMVFSSTAAVYGEPAVWPITEDMPTVPTNVYGRTKLMIEHMLADYAAAYKMAYVALRYFNAAGALSTGEIGEDHSPETHLIPLVLQAAAGKREAVAIFGDDYPTLDGTCIRDYIHVTDLADAHVLALRHLMAGGAARVFNLGSEAGYSVRQVIERAQAVTGVKFPVNTMPRRPGDPAVLIASSASIKKELGWQPRLSELDTIIASAWQWHNSHPDGYGKSK